MGEKTHSAYMPKAPDWSTTQDPSALTTQLVLRELASVNAVFDERFKSILVQIASIEKAQTLFETNLTRVPTDVDKAISQLKEFQASCIEDLQKQLEHLQKDYDQFPALLNEKVEHLRPLFLEKFHSITADIAAKFEAVQTQISERDERVKQAATDRGRELDAALAAAKELISIQNTASTTAIAKSETATDKRLDQIITILQTSTGALESKIAILNEQSKNMMPRQEVQQLFSSITDKLDGPTGLAMRLEGMIARGGGMKDSWGILLAVIGAMGVLFGLWHVK